jgi:hypothetical protein
MKLAIIFLSCMSLAYAIQTAVVNNGGEELLADGYIWGRKWDSNRRYECEYVSELQIISCFSGLVECEALTSFDDLSQNYEVFALGSTDLVNYQLYPRNFSDKQYKDSRVPLVGGGLVTLGLFSSGSGMDQNQRGIWVRDAACAKKIADLIQVMHPEPELVQLVNQKKVTVYGYVVQLTAGLGQSSNKTIVGERDQVIPFGKSYTIQQGQQVLEKLWRLEDSTRRAECKYVASSKILSCFRGLVKCEATLSELNTNYEVFGLGTTDMVNYRLYPRNLTDVKYSDYKVKNKSGSVVELSLYPYGVEGNGLMVRDAICYQRIVDTLRVLNVPNTVTIEGEQSDARVSMMGYVVSCKTQPRGSVNSRQSIL